MRFPLILGGTSKWKNLTAGNYWDTICFISTCVLKAVRLLFCSFLFEVNCWRCPVSNFQKPPPINIPPVYNKPRVHFCWEIIADVRLLINLIQRLHKPFFLILNQLEIVFLGIFLYYCRT